MCTNGMDHLLMCVYELAERSKMLCQGRSIAHSLDDCPSCACLQVANVKKLYLELKLKEDFDLYEEESYQVRASKDAHMKIYMSKDAHNDVLVRIDV